MVDSQNRLTKYAFFFLMEKPQIVHIIAISFPFIKALLQRTLTNFFKCVIFSHHNRNKRYYSIVNVKDFYLLVLKEIYISAFLHSLIALRCFFLFWRRICHIKIQLLHSQIKDIQYLQLCGCLFNLHCLVVKHRSVTVLHVAAHDK